jgi:L-fucose mutarotase/ribose pyranase (RbsD/FucU family)
MFKNVCALVILLAAPALHAAPLDEPASWQAKVAQALPLLGHRNWILIVDSAYPLQASPGIETIDTGAPLTEVLRAVLTEIDNSEHVRPDIYMDAELPFVPDQDAPGASQYRGNIADMLRAYPVQSLPHDKLIARVDDEAKTFQVLVLKTNMTIPYSSVFIHLNCKYWSDEAEARLRAKMGAGKK